MHFCAYDCVILCHADHHTPGASRPQTGVPSENIPPLQRALFFGMVTRGCVTDTRTTAPKKKMRNTRATDRRNTDSDFLQAVESMLFLALLRFEDLPVSE